MIFKLARLGKAVKFFLSFLLFYISLGDEEATEAKQHRNFVWGEEIPSDSQVRTLLDGIEPSVMGEVLERNLGIADEAGIIEGYQVPDGGVLPARDGLWHYSSKGIHCEHCLYATNENAEMTWRHSAVPGR